MKRISPPEYHDFLDLFNKKLARDLPPHRPYNHSIPFIVGKEPPFGPLYSISMDELLEFKENIEEDLSK